MQELSQFSDIKQMTANIMHFFLIGLRQQTPSITYWTVYFTTFRSLKTHVGFEFLQSTLLIVFRVYILFTIVQTHVISNMTKLIEVIF